MSAKMTARKDGVQEIDQDSPAVEESPGWLAMMSPPSRADQAA
jgi:hypothetical protein